MLKQNVDINENVNPEYLKARTKNTVTFKPYEIKSIRLKYFKITNAQYILFEQK